MPLDDPSWDARAAAHLIRLASSGAPFTADDLHTTDLGTPPHPNAVKQLIDTAKRAGLIHTTGYRKSTRGPRRGGWSLEWTGTQTQENAA